jgi:hypothetical protein
MIVRFFRWLFSRLSALVVLAAIAGRIRRAWRGHAMEERARREAERTVLPSLYDVHTGAGTAPRRAVGIRSVPIDRIVGTLRNPSQNTADFLPLPRLRGQNWRARWQRINRAMDRLAMLPPIDLGHVGDDYSVEDGHNRVAAARQADAVDLHAYVPQLPLPGVKPGRPKFDASSLVGTEEVRQAGTGRHSRTVEQRTAADAVSRRDLLRNDDA